ncbi:MAG: response regulator [Candidatus Peribacteria bacterium]|nr:MAG: response regulator [Candidatus Peribacteria bacterium]
MNILIIEDDIYLAERLKKVFEKKLISNRINILHDYESFVRELPVIDSYDLVLTDILLGELHDKTGIDVINTIRKKNIKVPVVVISSF